MGTRSSFQPFTAQEFFRMPGDFLVIQTGKRRMGVSLDADVGQEDKPGIATAPQATDYSCSPL